MMSLRIAYDQQIFELQAYGGISRYFCELAAHMARLPSCEVGIVAPLHVNEYLRASPQHVYGAACYVGKIPKFRRVTRALNRRLAPAVMRFQRPGIVHRTYYAPAPPAVAGARTVITVYDMIHEHFQAQMADDANARGKRAAIAAADHAICISESTRRDLIDLFDVDPAKTSVVHLGFDLMPSGDEPGLSLPGRSFILYVGQRAGYKNFAGLLGAYAVSPRLRDCFDIVCFGGGPFDASEQQAIASAGLRPDAVRQLGGADAVLRQLYRHAAMFVYPSLYEGFGIPPLEAMSFGCPVVCCAVASMPEVVGDAASYFLPDEPESLALAIERVADDEALRTELIRRGHDRLKLFSWQRCAEQTLDIYKGLLS